MKSVTTKQMKALDRAAIERCGIPSLILMENAGRGIADLAEKMLSGRKGTARRARTVLVICGKGNNGGDGMVAARHLTNRGFKVKVVLLGKPNELTDDAKINYGIVRKMRIPVKVITSNVGARHAAPLHMRIKKSDLVIDAIFGVGLTRPVEGVYREAISLINSCRKPVLAVDIPSGLDSDKGKALGVAVRAKMTGTLAVLKRGLVAGDGPAYAGKIKVIDISIPRQLISRYTDAKRHPRMF